jgi:hypothetical protein
VRLSYRHRVGNAVQRETPASVLCTGLLVRNNAIRVAIEIWAAIYIGIHVRPISVAPGTISPTPSHCITPTESAPVATKATPTAAASDEMQNGRLALRASRHRGRVNRREDHQCGGGKDLSTIHSELPFLAQVFSRASPARGRLVNGRYDTTEWKPRISFLTESTEENPKRFEGE